MVAPFLKGNQGLYQRNIDSPPTVLSARKQREQITADRAQLGLIQRPAERIQVFKLYLGAGQVVATAMHLIDLELKQGRAKTGFAWYALRGAPAQLTSLHTDALQQM